MLRARLLRISRLISVASMAVDARRVGTVLRAARYRPPDSSFRP